MKNRILNLLETADYTGLSPITVSGWSKLPNRPRPCIKASGYIRYSTNDLDKFIETDEYKRIKGGEQNKNLELPYGYIDKEKAERMLCYPPEKTTIEYIRYKGKRFYKEKDVEKAARVKYLQKDDLLAFIDSVIGVVKKVVISKEEAIVLLTEVPELFKIKSLSYKDKDIFIV